jgi:hypothetical protein
MRGKLDVYMQLMSYFIRYVSFLLSAIELECMAKRMYLHL